MTSVVLLDTSSSMAELVGAQRRIDVLHSILATVLPPARATSDVRLVAFNSVVRELDGARVPEPAGGTALHLALEFVAPMRPVQVIVISDGEPYDPEAALRAARALDCHIVTYFCGDERNHAAVAFLRALAWCSRDGFGQAAVSDLRDPARLTAELRLALAGPDEA
jgi:hypothetical protein